MKFSSMASRSSLPGITLQYTIIIASYKESLKHIYEYERVCLTRFSEFILSFWKRSHKFFSWKIGSLDLHILLLAVHVHTYAGW